MKNAKVILAAALTTFAVIITGCGKPETSTMGIDMSDEKTAVVTLENSSKDSEVMVGTLEMEEGEELSIESEMDEGGKILIQLSAVPEEQSIDVLPEFGDVAFETEIEGETIFGQVIDPGSYMIRVKTLEKSNGTVLISAKSLTEDEYGIFTKVSSAEEAAKGAGLDKFVLPMDAKTDLGAVSDSKDWMNFRYLDGIAQADFPMGAASIVIRKGASNIDNGDVSGDYREYAYEWTQDVNGVEVKCFGNREGAAMKSIWTVGNYSYSINARGEGGEDDFGLCADDVSIWVAGIE